jgi:uridine phosphorylase
MVPRSAVRDEGTSYHYLPPAREVACSPEALAAIQAVLTGRDIPFEEIKTWTTDAFYRETKDKVKARRAEGCVAVEMECAALFAVAAHRKIPVGSLLYAGDDVSGETWDRRGYTSRGEVRKLLLELAVEACLRLEPEAPPNR